MGHSKGDVMIYSRTLLTNPSSFKGDPGCCSVTWGRGGPAGPAQRAKKIFLQQYISILNPRWQVLQLSQCFLQLWAGWHRNEQKNFKFWPEWLARELLNLSFLERAMAHSKLTHWDPDLVIPNDNVKKKHVFIPLSRKFPFSVWHILYRCSKKSRGCRPGNPVPVPG